MDKVKIVSFAPFPASSQEEWFLKHVDPSKIEFTAAQMDLSEDEVCETLADATIVLATPRTPFLNRKILESIKGVKLIQFLSVGYDRIDIDAAEELGIPVANNAGFNAITVAEHAVMMILVLQRKAFLFHDEVMRGSWPTFKPGDLWELRGRTLGILGLGAIGTEVARIARGFGARILYNKRSRLPESLEKELGVEYRPFEDLVKESDVLTVHVPLTDETRHIIGEDEIAMMRDGAIIVNTTRRDVVDEAALAAALREGKLYGVGIDVPKTSDDRAEELKKLFEGFNAITTSHVASGSAQIMERFPENISENIRRVLKGETPKFSLTTV